MEIDTSPAFGLVIEPFWEAAEAGAVGLEKEELAKVLLAVGTKYNFGLPPDARATQTQMHDFLHSLRLPELALAHACVLGRDVAWQTFLKRYREPLTQAGMGITGSAASGRELADSLYADLFGLTERGGQRLSPLAYYSGRGSLMGFLRTTLAQRNVDGYRRTNRETVVPLENFEAATAAPAPAEDLLSRLTQILSVVLASLTAEEQFVLVSYFLEQRTLLEISQMLRVHEATVSRRVGRLTLKIRNDLLRSLQSCGLSKRAAQEALETDPRDLSMNLRSLLQASRPSTFLDQEAMDSEQP